MFNSYSSCLVFPPFRLDTVQGQLWRGDELLPLRPKVLAVLNYLILHHNRVVSSEELYRSIWPRRYGAEYAPKQCIRELRAILGDTAEDPRFIATVGRRGYRFIGQLETPADADKQPAAEGIPSTLAGFLAGIDGFVCVGREAELAQLRLWFERSQRGERPVMFITGEPGIGKTTLIDAFAVQVLAQGGLWLGSGQCVPHHGGGEAYQPLLEFLSRLGQGTGRTRLLALLKRHAPTWLAQLPSLLEEAALAGLQRRIQGIDRERMPRELIEVLEHAVAETPGVLVLEDLQWSDVTTLDWLSAWAQRREPARLLLIGTYRPADILSHDHPLRTVIHELRLHRRYHELPLAGLSEAAVADYLQARFAGHALSPALVASLQQRTQGYPLFLVALIEEWLAHGLLRQHEGGWELQGTPDELMTAVPASVRQLIEYQFVRLDPKEQRVLEAASVAGLEFSAAAVAAGLATDLEQVESCCTGLARRQQFLQEHGQEEWPDGTVAAGYAFRHVLYHQVVYAQLSAGRRISQKQHIDTRLETAYGKQAVTTIPPVLFLTR